MPDLDQSGSYLICATPRTGSTLLCGLLADTGIAGKPESYFRLPDERYYAESWSVPVGPDGPHDYRDYARAAMAAGSTTNGVFAARVMWGTMEEVVAKLRAAYRHPTGTDLEVLHQVFGRTRFVHLQRGDPLAQAVSWARAEQTEHWQDGERTAPERPPRFDFNEVDRYLRTINAHNTAWREWFGSCAIAPLTVTYEDLVADMSGTAAAILRFLDLELPVDHVVVPRTRRQADELNEEWTSRYHAHATSAQNGQSGSVSYHRRRRPAQLSLMLQVEHLLREVSAQVIEPRFAALQGDDVWLKSPGEVVTTADKEAEQLLARRLGDLLPGTPVVGEEASSDDSGLLSCLSEDHAWLVDPLDGTANFVAGGTDWAVMVALVERGAIVASWIWRPADQVMYMAELGQGATRNGVPIRRTEPVPPISEMRGAVLTRFLDPVTSSLVAANRDRFGSVSSGRLCAGVDYPALIEGDQEFVLFSRTLPWDHAPGTLLLSECGGVACRLDGTPYGPTQQTSGLLTAATQEAWDAVRTALLGSQ